MDLERNQRWPRATVAACVGLLIAYAVLAWSAVTTKSPTIDEPIHLLSGWLALHEGDYRLELANPPLWKLWAAAGDTGMPVPLQRSGPLWQPISWRPVAEAPWARQTLFDTPGTDGGRFVTRGRAMMLVVALALGAMIALWSYRLAGPIAAVVATALFAFDPTFLGHGPLVKGDLAETLAMLTVGWSAWRFGRAATVGRTIAMGLACGAAVLSKFSGGISGPIVAALLIGRALSPSEWPVFGRTASTRRQRVTVAIVGCGTAALLAFAVVWACYQFRYRPAADPRFGVDLPAITAAAGDGIAVRILSWADTHRLLPQAFTAGLLNQFANARGWPGYLNGEVYYDGRWLYYPFAVAYKTPLAELAAFAMAAAVVLVAGLRRAWRRPGVVWTLACVAVPAAALGASDLAVRLNIGVRTVLPVFGYADVIVGLAAAWTFRRWPRLVTGTILVLALSLATTAARAWPDYIAFFNAWVGGPREGAAHLADANLDWGQDVSALVLWQRDHPDLPLYTDLFTLIDPAFYGLRFHRIWERTPAGRPELHLPSGPAVLAVSVSHLQGLYVDPDQEPLLSRLRQRKPLAVLHGTIYLFDYAPAPDTP